MGQSSSILPSVAPNTTSDVWSCAMTAPQPFTSFVEPTGALSSHITSYGSKLLAQCTETNRLKCTFPGRDQWCNFTHTANAPASIMTEYRSYAASNRALWEDRRAKVTSYATDCPYGWWNALIQAPAFGAWVTHGIYHGECHSLAYPTATAISVKSSTSPTLSATLAASNSTTTSISTKGPMRH